MTEPVESIPHRLYKTGDTSETDQVIKTILGQSQRVVVYTTENNELTYEEYWPENQHVEERQKAVSRFDQISVDIGTFVPQKMRKRSYHQLGKALYSALDSLNPDLYNEFYGPIEESVQRHAIFSARFIYLVTSFSVTGLLGLVLCICPYLTTSTTAKSYLLGALSGLIGALVSVLQRSSTLELDYSQPKPHFVLQGLSRSILGLVFGAFIVLASKGNLFLGVVSNNEFSLLAFCFVAGVSERFVPEILEKMEISQLQSDFSRET